MARHGENIRKRGDGRWEARYLVKTETGSHYRSVYGHSYDEVKEKRERAMRTGIRNKQGIVHLRFGQAAEAWFSVIRLERKLSTVSKYRQVYDVHLKPFLEDCTISYIGFQNAVNLCYEQELSLSIQKSMRCVIGQVLQFVHKKYGMDIPVITYPEMKSSKVMAIPLSRSEQAGITLQALQEGGRYAMAILFGLYTGCRLGEICGLKWEDIDFKHKEFHVRRTAQRIYAEPGGKTVLSELAPKSSMSERCIPMTDTLVDLLSQLDMSHAYVFGKDKPLEPRTLQQHFHTLLQDAGLPSHNFHVLRHTFATNCIESRMDIKTLSELLGHADIKITLERYVHPTMESKRRQMVLFEAFCGQVHGQETEETVDRQELSYAVID